MNTQTNNLAVISNSIFEESESSHPLHNDISSALQKTLDFNELIQTFSTKIQNLVPHHGFIYTNPKFNLNILKGTKSSNSCSYKLTAEDMMLGELKLMRQNHFDRTEIYLLETLLSYLISPLKNATLFNQTLTIANAEQHTQTNNRPAFNESIKREITLSRRYLIPLSLIFIDINGFKIISDTYGHLCANRVLITIVASIKNSIRTCDNIYHYGGENFCILLSNTDTKGAELLSNRIRENIEYTSLSYSNPQIIMTSSIGTSCLDTHDTVNTFISRTESAMYQAIINGRNQIVIR